MSPAKKKRSIVKPTPGEIARANLSCSVAEAAETLVSLLNSENDSIRFKACLAILDRAGITAADRVPAWSAARDVGLDGADDFGMGVF